MITISVVSHGHGAMVVNLSARLLELPEVARLIVTLNIDEALNFPEDPRLVLVRNAVPKGFGANHNAAFARCESALYCVVNPDIELLDNPFPVLMQGLLASETALAAPLVLDASGQIEDSWRRFPSPVSLVLKALSRDDGTYPEARESDIFAPDWIAGMFLLFKSFDYAQIGGFDERFFLYYEDVDICARLHAAGRGIIGCMGAQVVHKAQRASWQSWRYRRFHFTSLMRYFSRSWRRLLPAALRHAAH
ncbi:glycosyltransferase family 2 protein [Planktotalea arctica]|uniref:glycosyltransferase family 2 protein n=1 Tax=Planktotalea arctica TaxID=1481893 RepID=UPI000A174BD3|nr:glycosyltransferase family 2 protein [Planktotalea arctica]